MTKDTRGCERMNEDNYQCSCGLCFFARDKELIEEHHKLTGHLTGRIRSVQSIMMDCIKATKPISDEVKT